MLHIICDYCKTRFFFFFALERGTAFSTFVRGGNTARAGPGIASLRAYNCSVSLGLMATSRPIYVRSGLQKKRKEKEKNDE
ncbi:hypothetical protein TNCV_1587481 [Trichonephila clavipes]|uniref:Uncharacterized protein n=1 Tax=Trichonephila clavipes TaxID=2585209 RepID=A0A8X6RNE4_TRICX|nr:hypothetical protein TNCV_1587481 [Trichonephila clavipes]